MRHNVDRNRGCHYGQPAAQPLLPSTALLPGKPFIQEYSHKPAETHVEQYNPGETTGRIESRKDSDAGRPTFREDLGQHRYRPYPVPEARDHNRLPSESAERGRNWEVRDRPNEEIGTSDSSGVKASDITATESEKVTCQSSISEPFSSALSAAGQSSAVCQSAECTSTEVVYTSAKPELTAPREGFPPPPPSSTPVTFSAGENLQDKRGEHPPASATMAENETGPAVTNVQCLPPPIPPYFPAFLQHVRNLMFSGGQPRSPFNPMPGPRVRGALRPPPGSFPIPPVPVNVPLPVCQGSTPLMPLMNTPPPLSGQGQDTSFPSKKPLLGDHPPLMAETNKDTGLATRQQQSDSSNKNVSAPYLLAPPKLLDIDQTQNTSDSQLPLDSETGEESDDIQWHEDESMDQEDSSSIPPLMDFSVYRDRPVAQEPRPPPLQFGTPLLRVPPPNLRGRMPIPRGMRVPRHMPPALRPVMDMRGRPDFPRRARPPFPPRGASRHPQH